MRRYGTADVGPSSDSAVISWPVPNECVVNSIKGECHVAGEAVQAIDNVSMYAVEGWILQSESPATDFLDQDALWDAAVPKDDDLADLDSSWVADTDPVKEMGEVSVSQLFDQELLMPERVFQREKLISLANSAAIGFLPGTPDTFIPTDFFHINVTKKYKVMFDSGLVFGFASPAMNASADNDIIDDTAFQDGFYILKFLEEFIDKAMIDITGKFEAGAESPYEDIMTFLLVTLEKVNAEGTAMVWTSSTWGVAMKGIMGLRVPGRFSHTTMGPDGQAP